MRIRDAIAAAGGLLLAGEGEASAARARILHTDGTVEPIDLDAALAGEGEPAQQTLAPGDTLVIELQIMVSVLGYVRNPGYFPVQDGTRLSDAVGLAGGADEDGDLGQVILRGADGSVRTTNLKAVLVSGVGTDPVLSPGDAVYVPRESKEINVLGYVESPGQYERVEGDRVTDLITKAGGAINRPSGARSVYNSAGDLTQVVLTRRDGASQVLNLRAILEGEMESTSATDPLVEAGDTIYVPEERYEAVVLGHVVRPGRYLLLPGYKASDALAQAGGPLRPTTIPATTTAADLQNVSLYRADGDVLHLDMSFVLTGSEPTSDPEIMPGDTLVVPEAQNRVTVEGYVDNPGYYEFRPGERVSHAIGLAGGVLTNVGSRAEIMVRRADGTEIAVDLDENDIELLPGDSIRVPFARNRVAVVGYVRSPGLYEWHEGDRAVDLIALAGGAIPKTRNEKGGDFYHAALIRKVDGQDQIYELDLGAFYDDGVQEDNLELQPDDIIFVPRSDHTDYGGWLGNILSGLSAYNLADILFF
jgi:protein involved in polysaccharide export with SLBB domain